MVYFNLSSPWQHQLSEFADSIRFSQEVRQFLALRASGVSLEDMIATFTERSEPECWNLDSSRS